VALNPLLRRGLPAAAAALVAALLLALWMRRPAEPDTRPAANADSAASAAARVGQPAASAAATPALSASQVERGIAAAREAVERDPKDAAAWAMLAHAHEMMGRFDLAGPAYEKLLALRPQDAQVHADYADALGVDRKGSLQGEPARLIEKALKLDPRNLKALVLAGKEAFERQRYGDAIAFWERALQTTTDVAIQRPIQTSMAEARSFIQPGSAASASSAGGLAFVAGRVEVADALKSRIGPEDTVFIFARPADGSRMPVALLRKKGRDLPLDFALDDTLAMVPQARLSQHAQVMVGVRVSKRGDAIPAAGDLEGQVGLVPLGSTGLKLAIDHARP
jgi:cytochrome c-type biogenesis protein CcmH